MKSNWTAVAALVAVLSACASTQIGNPDDYTAVPMNRVVPYPSEEELASLPSRIALLESYTDELSGEEVESALERVQRSLERYLEDAGAVVSRPEESAFGDAEWAIVSRINLFGHRSAYAPPKSLFKSEEELADEPGTCTHTGEIEVELRIFRAPDREHVLRRYLLNRTDDISEKQHDRECPLSAARRAVLLEEILDESIPCLEIPIKNRLSPRGYLLEQRSNEAGDKQIYKTSLGRSNGARSGLELEILRVQHMTTDSGNEVRQERKIAEAFVTAEVEDDHSWISLKPRSLQEPLLAGDLVRGHYDDSLVADLGLGKCKRILTVDESGGSAE